MNHQLKENVSQIISKKNMVSNVSESQWKILQRDIKKLPFPPPYIIKNVCENEQEYHDFKEDVWYWGDWSNEFF